MARIIKGLIQHLEAEGRKYLALRGEHVSHVNLGFEVDDRQFQVTIVCDEVREFILVYVKLDVVVPEHRLSEAMEFVCRANNNLAIGNLELDLSDGEVLMKVSADWEGAECTSVTYENLIRMGLTRAVRYTPALRAMVERERISPADAVNEAEGGFSGPRQRPNAALN